MPEGFAGCVIECVQGVCVDLSDEDLSVGDGERGERTGEVGFPSGVQVRGEFLIAEAAAGVVVTVCWPVFRIGVGFIDGLPPCGAVLNALVVRKRSRVRGSGVGG